MSESMECSTGKSSSKTFQMNKVFLKILLSDVIGTFLNYRVCVVVFNNYMCDDCLKHSGPQNSDK